MNKALSIQVAWFALALIVLLLATSVALGLGGYDLFWFTVDGGGGTSSGGTFVLYGTAGQFDAGGMSGGPYSLSGGYWASAAAIRYTILLPVVYRGS
jgi:hypothetical protein